MIPQALLVIHLLATMQLGDYREREEAQTKLEASEVDIDYLAHIYRNLDVNQHTELKLRLKEVLKFRWKTEMSKKYGAHGIHMWDDFEKVLKGVYNARD